MIVICFVINAFEPKCISHYRYHTEKEEAVLWSRMSSEKEGKDFSGGPEYSGPLFHAP